MGFDRVVAVVGEVGVRPAEPADLAAVRGLQAQLAPQWTPDDPLPEATPREVSVWAALLTDDQRLILVADHDGMVVGLVDLVVVNSLLDGVAPHAILDSLVVDHAHRGQGVGRALVTRARAAAMDRGCRRLELLSSKGRTGAHAFYRAMGLDAVAEGFRQDLPS